MPGTKRQLKLGAFLPGTGHHIAAWRHPAAQADGDINLDHYVQLARTAERAKFDMIFLADVLALWDQPEDVMRSYVRMPFEPITLLSALAGATTHIGLVATCSTTYNEPFTVARQFGSLDHLSKGRAGWNVVTSSSDFEAQNFNQQAHPKPAERYARAGEFVDVAKALWDSWADDSFVYDQEQGIFLAPETLRRTDHEGPNFKVRGPLHMPRSPQGHPVIVQAGSSEIGQDLAARTADVVFTAQQTKAEAQLFYRSLKSRLAKFDRADDDLKIMPGLSPIVGATMDEAQRKYDALQALIHPSLGLHLLMQTMGLDLSDHPLDEPIPHDLELSSDGTSRQHLLFQQALREGLSVRQLYMKVAGARGHNIVIGTAETIADEMIDWFEGHAADGFNIMPPYLPGGFDDFADLVVPELQRRGAFRSSYEGTTLRDNLGCSRPNLLRRPR